MKFSASRSTKRGHKTELDSSLHRHFNNKVILFDVVFNKCPCRNIITILLGFNQSPARTDRGGTNSAGEHEEPLEQLAMFSDLAESIKMLLDQSDPESGSQRLLVNGRIFLKQ